HLDLQGGELVRLPEMLFQAGPGEPALARGVDAHVVVAVDDEHVAARIILGHRVDDGLGQGAGPHHGADEVRGDGLGVVDFQDCHVRAFQWVAEARLTRTTPSTTLTSWRVRQEPRGLMPCPVRRSNVHSCAWHVRIPPSSTPSTSGWL